MPVSAIDLPAGRVGFRFARCAFAAALLLLGISNGVAAKLTPDEFRAQPAFAHFKESRYEDALRGFQGLLDEHPDDVRVMRYIGLTHFRLEDFARAVEIFDQALRIAPGEPALHFFRGKTLLEMGDRQAAIAAYREVVALKPFSLYGLQASQYLSGIGQQTATYVPPTGARPWDLTFQVGAQYDDNVVSAPDGFIGEESGIRIYEYAEGTYRVIEQGGWTLSLEGSTYQSQHPDGDLSELNLETYSGGVTGRYVTRLAGLPASFEVGYAANLGRLDGDIFNISHSINSSGAIGLADWATTEVFHSVSFDDFKANGFDRSISGRDGIGNSFGVNQYVFFDERRHYVSAGYAYRYNNAEGDNFDSHSHSANVAGSLEAMWGVRFDARVEAAKVWYPHFVGFRSHRTERLYYFVGASRNLWEGLSVSLSYELTDEFSTFSVLEFDRSVGTLTFIYTF